MAGMYGAITEMGAVEVLEPHDRAYFTACMVDIQEGGKKTLVRSALTAALARGTAAARSGRAARRRRGGGRAARPGRPPAWRVRAGARACPPAG